VCAKPATGDHPQCALAAFGFFNFNAACLFVISIETSNLKDVKKTPDPIN
jgi:hypothetical protein